MDGLWVYNNVWDAMGSAIHKETNNCKSAYTAHTIIYATNQQRWLYNFYLARMGTPQAAPACLPSANTRFPLTNVDKTMPDSSLPRYAEMFCRKNAKSVWFQFEL